MDDNNFIGKTKGIFILFLFLVACNDSSFIPATEIEQSVEISEIDAQPIIEIQSSEFLDNQVLSNLRDDVANRYGSSILELHKEKTMNENSALSSVTDIALLKELTTKSKAENSLSSHVVVLDGDAIIDEFLLGVRKYFPESRRVSTKSVDNSNDVWLALNPDKFHLEDDEYGDEIWPITIEAQHLSDENRQLNVTFGKNGLLSSYESNRFKTVEVSNPEIYFIDTVPIDRVPCLIPLKANETEETCGPSFGDGGGSDEESRVNDWSRGESTGTGGSNQTYFVLKKIRLATTGDGDESAELQLFSKMDDNYLNNMPVSYKYRFDRVYRSNPYLNGQAHTLIQGADRGGISNPYYEVPDINSAGIEYSFENTNIYYTKLSRQIDVVSVDYFPLFNLTQTSGPWRFVLVDDDKDYADMSSRRTNTRVMDINTYDMETNSWDLIETGFTTRNHRWGSSDDPLVESGVRNITLLSANIGADQNNEYTIIKWYGENSFSYTFGLETYSTF